MAKTADNNHFYYSNNFFEIIIEALVIILWIHSAGCSTIESFHAWIERSDWFLLIENVKQNCINVTKMCLIEEKTFTYTNVAVAAIFRAKKE